MVNRPALAGLLIASKVPEAGMVAMFITITKPLRSAVSPLPGTTPPVQVAPADQLPALAAVIVAIIIPYKLR
jgi:hypothetical protein